MKSMKTLMSSGRMDWSTPQDFFNKINKEFKFNLDPCATKRNTKCKIYYTKKDNGLIKSWKGKRVFVNPPYGRGIKNWVKKCYDERKNAKVIVLLIPARTDTKYFHKYIYHKSKIRFLKGRLRFSNHKNPAPFPCMLIIFKNKKR